MRCYGCSSPGDLPSVEKLRAYEPPLPTNVRGIDGVPIHSYARERRVELSYAEDPPLLVRAFLAAEDKTFFEHHGVDYPGMAGAVIDYATKYGSGQRAKGGSTITQQVAKNLLIGNQYSPTRKMKEAILAYRIEDALTKQEILELYLNQIALGRNSFGVEAASYAYFNKDLSQLDLAQMAYLAILPKGPSNYDPIRNTQRALDRRNYVLREMLKNGFIDQAQHDTASRRAARHRAAPDAQDRNLGRGLFRRGSPPAADRQVRRGPEGRTVQRLCRGALGADLARPEDPAICSGGAARRTGALRSRSWLERAAPPCRDGRRHLADGPAQHQYQPRLFGLARGDRHVDRGQFGDARFRQWPDGHAAAIGRPDAGARSGRHRLCRDQGRRYFGGRARRRRVRPALDPQDLGRVRRRGAGGRAACWRCRAASIRSVQAFNRATQAMRQPGSTIKPIVYATALDTA